MCVKQFFIANKNYSDLEKFIVSTGYKNIFLVCGHSIEYLQIGIFLKDLTQRKNINFIRFSDFEPNPKYDSVVKGIEFFKKEKCEAILAIGGGSAIDVAKCIKLFNNMDMNINYLKQPIVPNDIELFAVPTTAGTGSEATRFAVIYYNGEKQSISDYSCIPTTVIFDISTLNSLPDYQRKVTMLDALCHALESFWSVNSTKESRDYSKAAIQRILGSMDLYLNNSSIGNEEMLKASNIAGKAINITQTTAGHAMCYKLTSLYNLAHGHAAALCVSKIWAYMINNIDKCIDPRGQDYLLEIFNEISSVFACSNAMDAVQKFEALIKTFELDIPNASAEEYIILRKSVNPMRLKNNPVELNEDTIDTLYHEVLHG